MPVAKLPHLCKRTLLSQQQLRANVLQFGLMVHLSSRCFRTLALTDFLAMQRPALTSQHLSAAVLQQRGQTQLGDMSVIFGQLAQGFGICAHSAIEDKLLKYVPAQGQLN